MAEPLFSPGLARWIELERMWLKRPGFWWIVPRWRRVRRELDQIVANARTAHGEAR